MTASQEVAPRTTGDWIAGQEGVETFHAPDGSLAMTFSPQFTSRFNFLGPQAQVCQLDPSWRPIPKVERLNKDTDAYKSKGKWHLTKQGLTKLANLAGIEKDGTKWDYMEGAGVSVTVRARQRTLDGTPRYTEATKTVWFSRAEAKIRREGANVSESEIEKRLDEFYDFVASKQETKAYLRCVRELLSLPSDFTEAQLAKPFFVLGVAFVPDWSNPQVSKLLDLNFKQGSRELYASEPHVETIPTTVARQVAPSSGDYEGDLRDSWDDDDEDGSDPGASFEGEESEPAPVVPPPTDSFTPAQGEYEGIPVEIFVATPAGRVWLADAVSRMKDAKKREQGLAWLSWACQREITVDTLDTVA